MSATTLPLIDSIYPLDREAMFRFRQDGHAYLPAVLSVSEVPGYRSAIQSAAEALRNSPPPLADRDVYGQAFLKYMNIWSTDEGAKRFVLAKRFARTEVSAGDAA